MWQGEHVTCTSFAEDNSYFVACSYNVNEDSEDYSRRIKHRFKITQKDLKKARKLEKQRKAEQ